MDDERLKQFDNESLDLKYETDGSVFTPKYNSREPQNGNRTFSTFGDCVYDFLRRHRLLAIPMLIFYWFPLLLVIYLPVVETEDDNLESSLKGIVKCLFKNRPIYGLLMTLIVLMTPVILCDIELDLLGKEKNTLDFNTCLFIAWYGIFITSFVTNIISVILSGITFFFGLFRD